MFRAFLGQLRGPNEFIPAQRRRHLNSSPGGRTREKPCAALSNDSGKTNDAADAPAGVEECGVGGAGGCGVLVARFRLAPCFVCAQCRRGRPGGWSIWTVPPGPAPCGCVRGAGLERRSCSRVRVPREWAQSGRGRGDAATALCYPRGTPGGALRIHRAPYARNAVPRAALREVALGSCGAGCTSAACSGRGGRPDRAAGGAPCRRPRRRCRW